MELWLLNFNVYSELESIEIDIAFLGWIQLIDEIHEVALLQPIGSLELVNTPDDLEQGIV